MQLLVYMASYNLHHIQLIRSEGACSVTVIVVGNGPCDESSNLGPDCLYFTQC